MTAAAAGQGGSSCSPASRPPAADVADRHGALPLRRVHLVEHPVLTAEVAGDPHEPRRERRQRLVEGFACGGQRVVAAAAPVPFGDRSRGHAASEAARCCRTASSAASAGCQSEAEPSRSKTTSPTTKRPSRRGGPACAGVRMVRRSPRRLKKRRCSPLHPGCQLRSMEVVNSPGPLLRASPE